MATVEWSYHRNGWQTCAKTQGFLAKRKISPATQVDAKKQTIKGEAALSVLAKVDEIHVARGKRVTHVDLRKSRPAKSELLELLLGPHGQPASAHPAEGTRPARGVRRSDLQAGAGV